MPLPFSYKGCVALSPWSSGNNTTTTAQVQNSCEDKKGRLKTSHVAGMSSFKNEKRIIFNTIFFHSHLKIQTIASRRLKFFQEVIIFFHDVMLVFSIWHLEFTAHFMFSKVDYHITYSKYKQISPYPLSAFSLFKVTQGFYSVFKDTQARQALMIAGMAKVLTKHNWALTWVSLWLLMAGHMLL